MTSNYLKGHEVVKGMNVITTSTLGEHVWDIVLIFKIENKESIIKHEKEISEYITDAKSSDNYRKILNNFDNYLNKYFIIMHLYSADWGHIYVPTIYGINKDDQFALGDEILVKASEKWKASDKLQKFNKTGVFEYFKTYESFNYDDSSRDIFDIVKDIETDQYIKFENIIKKQFDDLGYHVNQMQQYKDGGFEYKMVIGKVPLKLNKQGISVDFSNNPLIEFDYPEEIFNNTMLKIFKSVKELDDYIKKNKAEHYFFKKLNRLSKTGIFDK